MKFFVVRHRPTQQLLPARQQATRWEFDDPNGVHEPRLFRSERAAKNCCTCWAAGVWKAEIKTDRDGWESPAYDYQDTPAPHAVPGRKREDLEVLPVELVFAQSIAEAG